MSADDLFLTLILTLPPLAGASQAQVREARPEASASVAPAPLEQDPRAEDDEEPVELTLEELIAAKYEPGEALDEDIAELDGKKVTVSGLMAIGTEQGLESFELVSDACGCGQSKVNHFIKVILVDETTSYDPNELQVTGTFEASEEIVDGFVVSVYRIVADKVE